MTNRFTPGPWVAKGHKITDGYGNKIVTTARDLSCDVHKSSKVANAHLIAAAPELLGALEATVQAINESEYDFNPMKEAVVKAQAAIKKARW